MAPASVSVTGFGQESSLLRLPEQTREIWCLKGTRRRLSGRTGWQDRCGVCGAAFGVADRAVRGCRRRDGAAGRWCLARLFSRGWGWRRRWVSTMPRCRRCSMRRCCGTLGCTACSHEASLLFGDEISIKRASVVTDFDRPRPGGSGSPPAPPNTTSSPTAPRSKPTWLAATRYPTCGAGGAGPGSGVRESARSCRARCRTAGVAAPQRPRRAGNCDPPPDGDALPRRGRRARPCTRPCPASKSPRWEGAW